MSETILVDLVKNDRFILMSLSLLTEDVSAENPMASREYLSVMFLGTKMVTTLMSSLKGSYGTVDVTSSEGTTITSGRHRVR